MAHTASSLEQVLKEVWNDDTMRRYMDVRDLEMQGALMDTRRGLQRQMFTMPITLDMSPVAVHARKQRQLELEQRMARMKRGNKPSYRQRQKNGRKAAGR